MSMNNCEKDQFYCRICEFLHFFIILIWCEWNHCLTFLTNIGCIWSFNLCWNCFFQGSDSVMECVHDSKTGKVEVFLSYNEGKHNERLTNVSTVINIIDPITGKWTRTLFIPSEHQHQSVYLLMPYSFLPALQWIHTYKEDDVSQFTIVFGLYLQWFSS